MKPDDELKWVRIFDPIHIPKKYVEQIKEREFSVENFYKFQRTACIEKSDTGIVLNPFNLLYVIVDKENLTKGFCWFVVDILCSALVINSFSMDDAFWGNGSCIKLLEDKAREIQEGAKLERIYWVTRCPKHSEKYGFKRSKHVLMEYKGHGKCSKGDASEAGGSSGTDDPGTTAVLEDAH